MIDQTMRPAQSLGTEDRSRSALGEGSWRRHAYPGPALRMRSAANRNGLALVVLERNAYFTRRLQRLRMPQDIGNAAAILSERMLRRPARGGADVRDEWEAAVHGRPAYDAAVNDVVEYGAGAGAGADGKAAYYAASQDVAAFERAGRGRAEHGAAVEGRAPYDVLHGKARRDAAVHRLAAHDAAVHSETAPDAAVSRKAAHDGAVSRKAAHDGAVYPKAAHDAAAKDMLASDEAAQDAAVHDTAAHGNAVHDDAFHDEAGLAAAGVPGAVRASPEAKGLGNGPDAAPEPHGQTSRAATSPARASAPAAAIMRALLPTISGSAPGAAPLVPADARASHAAPTTLPPGPADFWRTSGAWATESSASGAGASERSSPTPFVRVPLPMGAGRRPWLALERNVMDRVPSGPAWTFTRGEMALRKSTPGAWTPFNAASTNPAVNRPAAPVDVMRAATVTASLAGSSAAAEQEPVRPGPYAARAEDLAGAGMAGVSEPAALRRLDLSPAGQAQHSTAAFPHAAWLTQAAQVPQVPPQTLPAPAESSQTSASETASDGIRRPYPLQAVRRLQALREEHGAHIPAARSSLGAVAARVGLTPFQRLAQRMRPVHAPLIFVVDRAIAASPGEAQAGAGHTAEAAHHSGADRAIFLNPSRAGAGTAGARLASGPPEASWDAGSASRSGPGRGMQDVPLIILATTPAAPGGEMLASAAGTTRHAPDRSSNATLDSSFDQDATPPLIEAEAEAEAEAAAAKLWHARVPLARTPLPVARRRMATSLQLSTPHWAAGSNGPAWWASGIRAGYGLPVAMSPSQSRPPRAQGLPPIVATGGTTGIPFLAPAPPARRPQPSDIHLAPTAHETQDWTGADSVADSFSHSAADSHGVVPVTTEAVAAGQGLSHPGIAAQRELDLEQLEEHIWQSIMDRLVVEQERRGTAKWP